MAVPARYKLIKTKDGYQWRGLNGNLKTNNANDDHIDYGHTEIETWKGVYRIIDDVKNAWRTIPTDDSPYPISYCKTWYGYFHPITQRLVQYQVGNFQKQFHDDIIAWIESQPPQPDNEQAEKDRVEVAQLFAEF